MKNILTILLIAFGLSASSRIVVTHFNAEWNDPNKVAYIGKLTDSSNVSFWKTNNTFSRIV